MDTCNVQGAVILVPEGRYYLFECPHCQAPVQVSCNQVNCRIFRHGQYKNTYAVRITSTHSVYMSVRLADIRHSNSGLQIGNMVEVKNPISNEFEEGIILNIRHGEQLNPHLPKKECDRLVDEGAIWGCGKPFMLHFGNTGKVERVTSCGYT